MREKETWILFFLIWSLKLWWTHTSDCGHVIITSFFKNNWNWNLTDTYSSLRSTILAAEMFQKHTLKEILQKKSATRLNKPKIRVKRIYNRTENISQFSRCWKNYLQNLAGLWKYSLRFIGIFSRWSVRWVHNRGRKKTESKAYFPLGLLDYSMVEVEMLIFSYIDTMFCFLQAPNIF